MLGLEASTEVLHPIQNGEEHLSHELEVNRTTGLQRSDKPNWSPWLQKCAQLEILGAIFAVFHAGSILKKIIQNLFSPPHSAELASC